MSNFFQRRRLKKAKKHILHEARHARYMREDIAEPEVLERLSALEKELEASWARGNSDEMEGVFKQLNDQVRAVYPAPEGAHKMRENVEIVVVALAVALGFRTYFIQPYKIPTGSMQPTLNGIRMAEDQSEKTLTDTFPLWIPKYLMTGTRYKEVHAKREGFLTRPGNADNFGIYNVGGTYDHQTGRIKGGANHKIHAEMPLAVEPVLGSSSVRVAKGQILAKGRLLTGDQILVNKMKYNFMRPKRGDITVFSTDGIKHPQIKEKAFYIKRMVGLPGEDVSLSDKGYLQVNGEKVLNHSAFDWPFGEKFATGNVIGETTDDSFVVRNTRQRYPLDQGPYTHERKFVMANKGVKLTDEQYLFFGDNTLSSLDGRYFGGVNRNNIIGPAFAVYWPFVERSKWIKNK